MSNFKVGEKVVFVGSDIKPNRNTFRYPMKHEIVTVHSFCDTYVGNLDISEYLIDSEGYPQSFNPRNFRKLDYDFAENILAEIREKAQVEYQLN